MAAEKEDWLKIQPICTQALLTSRGDMPHCLQCGLQLLTWRGLLAHISGLSRHYAYTQPIHTSFSNFGRPFIIEFVDEYPTYADFVILSPGGAIKGYFRWE